jgi:hypothetical protein
MKFITTLLLLSILLTGCLTKVRIISFREEDFSKPKRVYTIVRAAKDEDLTEFQSKFCFRLQEYLLDKGIKNDYYVARYSYDKIDSAGYSRLSEFAPEYYFEMGATTENSQLNTSIAEAAIVGVAREGADYEMLLRDFKTNKIVWRGKLAVSSVLGSANGQKKAMKFITEKFEKDQLF